MSDLRDQAIQLMQAQRYGEALTIFSELIKDDPTSWNDWYMQGQCCRFVNDISGALKSLRRAGELNPGDSGIFLALGIALQLSEDLPGALDVLHKAIHLDPDYDLGYNSIGITLRKMGEFERADKAYDAGLNALARRIVKGLTNDVRTPLSFVRPNEFSLWVERAMFGAMFLCASEPEIDTVSWPTGEQAIEEDRTHAHGGRYWIDTEAEDSKTTRYFLPNYFNTFQEILQSEPAYANLLGNRGVVLEELGRNEEAREHCREAHAFMP